MNRAVNGKQWLLPTAAWAYTLASFGCAQVIGLEEAHEDPSFDPAGPGGTTGSMQVDPKAAGQGGASQTAGIAGTVTTPSGAGGEIASSDKPGSGAGTPAVVSAGASSGEAGSAGRGTATVDELCSEYCETVMQNCKPPFAVYTSLEACLAVCQVLPAGDPDAEIGNNVACRLRNAQLANTTGEPDIHCPVAGPGGLGTCGSNCEGYCVIASQVCDAGFSSQFESLVDCNRQCEALTDSGAFDVTQKAGNTVGCRLWHSSAASLDPGTHCPHALGAPPCAP